MKLQHAYNSLEFSSLIKQESLWWDTLMLFYNKIGTITKTCSINKVKVSMT